MGHTSPYIYSRFFGGFLAIRMWEQVEVIAVEHSLGFSMCSIEHTCKTHCKLPSLSHPASVGIEGVSQVASPPSLVASG